MPITTLTKAYLGFGRVNLVGKRHCLFLSRDHAHNLLLFGELQFADALKTLLQMGLHTERVLGLRQDLQQLVIGQEEEPEQRPVK